MRKLLYILCIATLLFSCNKSRNQNVNAVQEESIDQTELLQAYDKADSLYQQGIINKELFEDFITQAIRFADMHPENNIIPDMLSKAGVACMILAKNASMEPNPNDEYIEEYARKGISVFEKIQATYPEYEGVRPCSSISFIQALISSRLVVLILTGLLGPLVLFPIWQVVGLML